MEESVVTKSGNRSAWQGRETGRNGVCGLVTLHYSESVALFGGVEDHFNLSAFVGSVPVGYAITAGVRDRSLRFPKSLCDVVQRVAEIEPQVGVAWQIRPDKAFDHLLFAHRKRE